MARGMPEAIGTRIEAWHRAAGVALEFGCALTAVQPGPDALHLSTSRGPIEADLLLVAIGAVPNAELAGGAGIVEEGGILADANGRTSHPQVFAAGEVASIWQERAGRHIRFETWQVAQYQPVAVANALCGTPKPYAELPWHWTDQYGHNVQILGAHYAALEWLERELPAHAAVIDYGCGSGILAIAAVLLGARQVVAIDIDPQALQSTQANALANPPAAQRLVVQDPHAPKPAAADVVLANILSMPLKLLAPVLISLLAPGGKLVLSGILQRQADEVAQAYRPALALEIYGEREGWVCLAGSAAQPHS
jgi:predicted nicotinamide N-methyase